VFYFSRCFYLPFSCRKFYDVISLLTGEKLPLILATVHFLSDKELILIHIRVELSYKMVTSGTNTGF